MTDETAGDVSGVPRALLRAEGALLAVLAVAAYGALGFSWWLFALVFLAPDLTFLGYLAGPRIGAASYNAAHTLLGPLALLLAGGLAGTDLAVALAFSWLAHIGMDRMLAYGLKYPDGFHHTHLRAIARR